MTTREPDARYKSRGESTSLAFALGASHDLRRPIPRKSKRGDSNSDDIAPVDLRQYQLRTIIVRCGYRSIHGLGAIYAKDAEPSHPSNEFEGVYSLGRGKFLCIGEDRITIQNFLPCQSPIPSRWALPIETSAAMARCIIVRHQWMSGNHLHIFNRHRELAMELRFFYSETGPYFTGTQYCPRGEFFEYSPIRLEAKNRMVFGNVFCNPKGQSAILVEGGLNSYESLYAFNLAVDESIVKIKLTYDAHRHSIENLCFDTSEGRKYGVFGDPASTGRAELLTAPNGEALKYFGGRVKEGLLKSLSTQATCPWDRRGDLLLRATLKLQPKKPEPALQRVTREGLIFSTVVLYL